MTLNMQPLGNSVFDVLGKKKDQQPLPIQPNFTSFGLAQDRFTTPQSAPAARVLNSNLNISQPRSTQAIPISQPAQRPLVDLSRFFQPSTLGQRFNNVLDFTVRPLTRFGASLGSLAFGGGKPIEPTNDFEKFIFGDTPVVNPAEQFRQDVSGVGSLVTGGGNNEAGKDIPEWAALPAGLLVGATSATPLGGGRKKVVEAAAQKAAKSGLPVVTAAKNGATQFLKQKFLDQNQVILDELRNIEKKTGQKGLVDKFMYNSNMQTGSNARANAILQSSPNLQKAFRSTNRGEAKAFSTYANVRTELSTAGKGVKTSLPRAELKAIVKGTSPQFAARFTALNAHYKDLAKIAHDAGIIDDTKYQAYIKNNDYIRLQRDMGDLLPDTFGRGRGNSYQLGSTITSQTRKGSVRETQRASETVAQYTQQIVHEAARNRTATHLADTLSNAGLATKLPNAQAARYQNVMKIIRNGKVEYYRVSPEMKDAINNISPGHMNIVNQVLAAPGRLLRATVTGLNPVFIARNLVKDQMGSAINSKNLFATHNPRSFFSGLYNAVKDVIGVNHNPIWQDFLEHYGDITSYDFTRNAKSTREIARRLEGGKLVGAGQAVLHPIRSLENLAAVTEKSSRFQQYVGEYRKAIKQGLPKEQASERAAIAAWQNSVDFSRAGEWGRVINTVIPYWNPSTQGVRQMFRSLQQRPIKTVFTATAVVGVPMVAATAWNLSDPQTKAVYDNIPEYEKDNNLILIPPGTVQNQDGSYDVWKIPLPPGVKDAFMPLRRSMEAFANDKPADAAQMATDILQSISGPIQLQNGVGGAVGSVLPQAVKPFVQQYANQDLFSGKQIVPDYINQATDAQGNPIPESKKAYPNSSGTAKQIGDITGVSPIRVEKFIKDTAGTVGVNVLNAVDAAKDGPIPVVQQLAGGEGWKRSFGLAQGIDNANKSAGAKYYDNVKKATTGLSKVEQDAFDTLHPASKNFLGETVYESNAVYNPTARLDIYNRFPKVFEADKQLDQMKRANGEPGNPLFDLSPDQVKKVLEHDNLPPGAKDPELSTLYNQEWFADYSAKKSAYFNGLAQQAAAQGKPFGGQDNPYPSTPPDLQKIMDAYTALPKGTGARSKWIKANPGAWNAMQNQFAAVDAWQNAQRVKRGLATTEGAQGEQAGYPRATLDYGQQYKYGARKKSNPTANPLKYSVSLASGGNKVELPKAMVAKAPAKKKAKATKLASKPTVTLKKSLA